MESGKLLVFSAPSGSGKTTLVHHLLAQGLPLEFSISATSRPPRAHEVDGKDYYFLSPTVFEEKINAHAFVEYEEVYKGLFYGTLKSELERIWTNGK
ncbi:MAG: guanylate kinase, partial [Flavobacteriales bacterium]